MATISGLGGGLQDNHQCTCGTIFPCSETLNYCRNYFLHLVDKHCRVLHGGWHSVLVNEPRFLPLWGLQSDCKGIVGKMGKILRLSLESYAYWGKHRESVRLCFQLKNEPDSNNSISIFY